MYMYTYVMTENMEEKKCEEGRVLASVYFCKLQ